MSTKYYWDWDGATTDDDLEARYDALWDDCPRHAGIGCAPLLLGSLDTGSGTRVYFAATVTESRRIAAILDDHYGVTGVLTRDDREHLSRMHAQYRRKKRGWK